MHGQVHGERPLGALAIVPEKLEPLLVEYELSYVAVYRVH